MESLLNTSSSLTTPEQQPPLPTTPNQRLSRLVGARPAEPPEQQQQLACPRCESNNTKFCYYNNYNLSQPRHFCKNCRRYWTRGGTLRNVPVGGATRKNTSSSNKRPRIAATPVKTPTNSNENEIPGQTQIPDLVVANPGPGLVSGSGVDKSGNLSCWWGAQMGVGGGLLPFNGYGLGLGPGMGYENGVLDWSMEQVRGGGDGGAAAVESPGCDTWQMGGGEDGGGVAGGDYLSWPELAISTPAKALK